MKNVKYFLTYKKTREGAFHPNGSYKTIEGAITAAAILLDEYDEVAGIGITKLPVSPKVDRPSDEFVSYSEERRNRHQKRTQNKSK